MLQSLLNQQKPTHLAVAFDVGKPTFRHEQFQAYKAQRKPTPDALISQVPVIKEVLAAYRIPAYEQAGFEAEDVLATIAHQVAGPGNEIFLVTGDKDALQLIGNGVQVYNPHAEPNMVDAAAVKARFGILPNQVADLLTLMGDSVDNIPGVPGIGEKTAVGLLQRFGDIDRLYAHLDEVDSPARRKSLEASREQVRVCRQLARITHDVPIKVKPDDLKVQEPDWSKLRALFRSLEFKRLVKEVESHMPAVETIGRPCRLIDATTPAKEAQTALAAKGQSALLVLTSEGQAPWVAVAPAGEMPVLAQLKPAFLESATGKALTRWLEDPARLKLAHNGKAYSRALAESGVHLAGLAGDTMIAAYLLNPGRLSPSLSELCEEELDQPLPVLDGEIDLENSSSAFCQALGQNVSAIRPLHERYAAKLEERGLARLYGEIEMPLVGVLADMEALGVALDVPYLTRVKSEMDAQLLRLSEEIAELAGTTFNLNSPKQLAQVLFEKLQLPVIKRTKTGPSTDSDVLQQLSSKHPLPKKIMEYRELSKLVSTYVEALPRMVNPKTGRVHTSFNQALTSTGRLSSSDPNLQNIPIRTELGRSIRKAFIPGIPDGIFIAADYSQIELRLLAHVSGDEQLTKAFREDRDIHRFTASLIYGIPEKEVQPEQRNATKVVNFGVLYGMSAHGLSKELRIPHEQAQAFIDAYFARYPRVRGYLDSQMAKAKHDGFVQTLFGRRRYIPEVNSPDPVMRQLGERMAINAPLQGTAADLIKRAMVDLAAALPADGLKSRLVLQVHDELVLECPKQEKAAVTKLVKRTMEGAMSLTVPLTVTVKAGPNWLDLSPVA